MEHSIGEEIRAARERRGLSLDALAAVSGVAKATVSKVETGRQEGRLSTLVALCRALDLSLDAMVGLRPRRKRTTAPVRRLLEEAIARLDDLEG